MGVASGPVFVVAVICDNVRPKITLVSVKKNKEKKKRSQNDTRRVILVDAAHPNLPCTCKIDRT